MLSWFGRKDNEKLQHARRVEISVSKDATEEAFNAAKQANKHLSRVLQSDDVTLKIYFATGGRIGKQKER